MRWKIDHIGIAVRDLESSLDRWRKALSLRIAGIETIEERGVRLAQLDLDEGPSVELISAFGEDSPVEKFLKESGEGIHHFCFEVDNLHQAIKELREKRIQFVEPAPAKGAAGSTIAFIHPGNFNGVLIELKEKS